MVPVPRTLLVLATFRVLALSVEAHTPPEVEPKPASKLHIVLMIDTDAAQNGGDDSTIRKGMRANLTKVTDLVKEIIKLQPEKFEGRVFSTLLEGKAKLQPERVIKTIRELPTDKNSSVLVYYCGHGATDPVRGHFFRMSGGDLLRSDIRSTLANKKVRAAILISDCCSVYSKFASPKRSVAAKWKAAHNLFFETHGMIDLTGASDGEFGWLGDEGGYFTDALTSVLCLDPKSIRGDGIDGFVNWESFFLRVRALTGDNFRKARNDAVLGEQITFATSQTPQLFSLGDPRTVFKYTLGTFFGDGGKWVEKSAGGTVNRFEETARSLSFIEMYDDSRQMYVRLENDKGVFSNKDRQSWRPWPGSAGAWDKDRSIFVQKDAFMWRVEGFQWIQKTGSGSIHRFEEVKRDSESIEIFDGSRSFSVQLRPGSNGSWLGTRGK
jgi:Caspase domain